MKRTSRTAQSSRSSLELQDGAYQFHFAEVATSGTLALKRLPYLIAALVSFGLVAIGCDSVSPNYNESTYGLPSSVDGELAPLCDAGVIDLALVIDMSGSMNLPMTDDPDGSTRLDAAKVGATALVNQLGSGDQAALVTFADVAARHVDLTMMDDLGRTAITNAIDALADPFGTTNTQGGIIYGAEELTGVEAMFDFVLTSPSGNDRPSVAKVMVILADGVSNRYYNTEGGDVGFPLDPHQQAIDAADAAKAAGIRIMTISIGEADADAMEELASSPADAFTGENIGELVEVFEAIAQAICPTAVVIDIKPGGSPNAINPSQRGNIPVAVLTTDDFDATTIDPETVRFGALDTIVAGDGASVAHAGGHLEDVDGDGRLDFVGHYPTQDTGFTSGDEVGWLVGQTTGGDDFAGRDTIVTVGN